MRVVRLGAVLGLICGAATWSACDRCSFRNLDRLSTSGTLDCCGSSAQHEVTIRPGTDRQVDLANTRIPTVAGIVDLWLAPGDCDKLFDAPYPGAAALCRTYLGPVAPGAVSARLELAAGRYRVFAQAHSSNAEPARYLGDVGIWGKDCAPSPTGPSSATRVSPCGCSGDARAWQPARCWLWRSASGLNAAVFSFINSVLWRDPMAA